MNKIIYRRIPAGKPGTKKLIERYGEDLVCVRYKYDKENGIKYKTVELIIDKGLWNPDRLRKEEETVAVKINFNEFDKRQKIRDAGGRWNKEMKVYELSYKQVKKLGLTDRIVWVYD